MSDQHNFGPVRALDENGIPVPGALAYFYIPGTTAPRDVYADEAETIFHPNPLSANAAGVFPAVYSGDPVKCTVTTPAGVTLPGYPMQLTMRSFGGTSQAGSVAFSPTVDLTSDNVQDAIEQSFNLTSARLDGLGTLSALSEVTTAQFAPSALRMSSEGVASPTDTEIPTVLSMTTHVENVRAALPIKTVFVSTQQTITSAGTLSISHGLGVVPRLVTIELVCVTDEAGYTAGNIVPIGIMAAPAGSGERSLAVVTTAASLNVRFATSANVFVVLDFSTGSSASLTNANWRVVFRAYA